jgi:hypothetical protein
MTRGRWLAAALVGGVLAAVTASAPATAAPPSDGPRHALDGIVQNVAFANPGLTGITAPNGAQALVITLFLPSEGASAGESGELIYYTTY